jgi:hypothetical protein
MMFVLALGTAETAISQAPPSSNRARVPQPEPATAAILAAFDSFRIVALGDAHGTKDLNDFTLALVRDSRFTNAANDIVVECLNSRLQPLLDRYVAGEDIPLVQVRALWRDQTHPPCSVDDFHQELIELVRRINQGRTASRQLRILAGEPPLDWPSTSPELHRAFLAQRDAHAATVVETEVLARNRKALVLYGLGHLFHGMKQMAVGRYEVIYPGVTFVIAPYLGALDGTRCGAPASISGTSLDALVASWPAPTLARTRGTLLDAFTASQFARTFAAFGVSDEPIDACLYLGPPRLLLRAPPSTHAFLDSAFVRELRRRATVMAGGSFHDDRIEPDKVRAAGGDVFACKAGS